MLVRNRREIDDRHHIRNPLTVHQNRIDLHEARIWSNTLAKERIPQLFKTERGLAGHISQLQNELNRFDLKKVKECEVDGVDELREISKFIKRSVEKSMEAATISLTHNLTLEFHMTSDKLII